MHQENTLSKPELISSHSIHVFSSAIWFVAQIQEYYFEQRCGYKLRSIQIAPWIPTWIEWNLSSFEYVE